jgi:hypothetical protein
VEGSVSLASVSDGGLDYEHAVAGIVIADGDCVNTDGHEVGCETLNVVG